MRHPVSGRLPLRAILGRNGRSVPPPGPRLPRFPERARRSPDTDGSHAHIADTGSGIAAGRACLGADAHRALDRAPVLVRQMRNGVVESVHRGDVVEVDAAGRMLRLLGDPDRVVYLRSTVKPYGLVALLRPAASRSSTSRPRSWRSWRRAIRARTSTCGRSRRCTGGSGSRRRLLACGTEGMPLDAAHGGPSRARRRAAGTAPPHVLRAALGADPARQAGRLGARDLLAGGSPGAGGVPEVVAAAFNVRPRARCAPGSTAAAS